jgi:hypothetical protein
MPGIDRSVRGDVIARFRVEFDISQPALGDGSAPVARSFSDGS